MMRKIILTALLLCICIIAFNQKGNKREQLSLRFSPLSLIDVYHPSVTFGAELRKTKKSHFRFKNEKAYALVPFI